MLTEKQRKLLRYLINCQRQDFCPSYDQMREHMELKAKSGIHRMITALEDRGFITRVGPHGHRALKRSIRVIRHPDFTPIQIYGVPPLTKDQRTCIADYFRSERPDSDLIKLFETGEIL